MKRPMIICLLACLLGEALSYCLKINILICVFVSAILCIIWLAIKRKGLVFLLMVFLSFLIGLLSMDDSIRIIDNNNNINNDEILEFNGLVKKIIIKDKYTWLYMKKESKTGSYIIITENNEIIPGDYVEGRGKYIKLLNSSNEGNFDEKKYYESLGIFFKIQCKDIKITVHEKNKFISSEYRFKNIIKKQLEKICDIKYIGILESILLGEKNELDEETKTLYKLNGISHILAISGLHVSLIGLSIYKLIRKKRGYLISSIVAFSIILFYGSLTGMEASTKRAVIMIGLILLAENLGRTYDGISSISTAIIIMVENNAMIIFNSGFLMSAGAIIGVYIASPAISEYVIQRKYENVIITKKKYEKLKKYLFDGIVLSISINIILLPILTDNFYIFSTYSIFTNLIIAPFIPLVIVGSIISIVCSFANIYLGKIIINIVCLILKFYEALGKQMLKIPGSILYMGKPKYCQVILYYIVLSIFIVVLLILKNKNINSHKKNIVIDVWWYRIIRKIIVLSMVLILFIIIKRNNNEISLTFLDVGQGDGIVIRNKNTVCLVDGGSTTVKNVGKYRIEPYLLSQGIHYVEYSFISHSDLDHLSGIEEMLKNSMIKIKKLCITYSGDLEKTKKEYENLISNIDIEKVHFLKQGDEFKVNNMKITCLYPNINDYDSGNNVSQVLKLDIDNFKALLTGDLEIDGENKIMDQYDKNIFNDLYVLKLGHHGSKNSTSENWLEYLKPQLAIVSAGENNKYKHPSVETLKRLEDKRIKVLSTINIGEIKFIINNDNM